MGKNVVQENFMRKLASLRNASNTNKLISVVVAVAVGVSGYMLITTQAASPFAAAEVEAGTVGSPATVVNDAAASAGKFASFSSAGAPGGSGATYYVDCNGNDGSNGTSSSSAWKSLSKASSAPLKAGDSLLLKRGCTWSGTLRAAWKGTATSNVTVSAYGTGAAPNIHNSAHGTNNISVTGSYITFENLNVSAKAPQTTASCNNGPLGYLLGFALESGSSFNTIKNNTISGFYAGVFVMRGSTRNKITNNKFTNNTMMWPNDTSNPDNDAGAFGILLWGDYTDIGYNNITGSATCSYDYGTDGAAVEVYGGQNNIIHHNKAINDDAFSELGDPRSANTTFAYNLYTSNTKSGIFINTRGAQTNLGPITGTKVYNNSVYLTGASSQAVVCYGGCNANILSLRNNILWGQMKSLYSDGTLDEGNNIYWRAGGNPLIQSPVVSSTSKKVDPKFVNPGANDLHLATGSPAINAGGTAGINAGFTSDLDNMKVPAGSATDVGAYETGSTPVGGGTTGCQAAPGPYGKITTTLNVPTDGSYRVWTRMKTPDAGNNSYWLVVDNACPINFGDTQMTAGTWTWLSAHDGVSAAYDLNLSAGNHTLQLISREPGVGLDRVMLVSDKSCTPTGTGDNCTTAPDTVAPTVAFTAPTPNQNVKANVPLAVGASDNAGGSGVAKVEYFLDSAPTPFATITNAPYSHTWDASQVAPGPHTLKAHSYDKAGNKSIAATVAINVETSVTPPSTPANLRTTNVTTSTVNLAWNASNQASGYKIYRNNAYLTSVTGTSFNDTSVKASTQYVYAVSAFNNAGGESPLSTPINVTTPQPPDTQPPSTPTNLQASALSPTKVSLAWTSSTDNVSGVKSYLVQRNGTVIAEVTQASYNDDSVLPGTQYTYGIYAVDNANNTSGISNFKSVTTPQTADTQPPSKPANLAATTPSSRQVNLNWQASTDNVGVQGYRVFRNNVQIGTTQSLSYADATVNANTNYNYHVVAYDAASNASPTSDTVNVKTPAANPSLSFAPTDDSFVEKNRPTATNGTKSTLQSDNSPLQRGIMKFVVRGTNGKIVTNAKLRLYASKDVNWVGGYFYITNHNNWAERTVNWNNQPGLVDPRKSNAALGKVKRNTWVEVDLSKVVKGDGTYSLVITNPGVDAANYNTKEASANRPQLIITTQ